MKDALFPKSFNTILLLECSAVQHYDYDSTDVTQIQYKIGINEYLVCM